MLLVYIQVSVICIRARLILQLSETIFWVYQRNKHSLSNVMSARQTSLINHRDLGLWWPIIVSTSVQKRMAAGRWQAAEAGHNLEFSAPVSQSGG
jgi:hypothetical protein